MAIYDDHCQAKARKALTESLHADVGIFHAYALAMGASEERRRRPPRSPAARLGSVKRWGMRTRESVERLSLAAAGNVKSCLAYFNRGERTTIGTPAEV